MNDGAGTAAAAGAVEGKTSLPPAGQGGAELLELARSTDAELTGAAPGGQQGAPVATPAPAIPLELELAGMFEMIGVGVGQFLPSVGEVLDEAACKKLGGAIAPVMRKYGLERYVAGFAWRVELQAIMVAGPIVAAVVSAARHDIARAKRAANARAPDLGAEIPAAAAAPQASSSPPAQMLKPIDQAEADRRELEEMNEIHRELEASA